MDNDCHITDLIKAFPNVEHGGLNLVLKLSKPLTCMAAAQNTSHCNYLAFIFAHLKC